MEEKIKILAQKTVDKIYQRIRKTSAAEFHKFGNNIGVGADGTTTKYIDKVAEDVAVGFIEKSKVKVNLLSEEAGFLDFGGEYIFVLDPIDGTRNAYRGIPFYSVSIGVGKSMLSDVEYGIVKNIPTGDVFVAEKKYGAFLNNKPVGVPECPTRNVFSSLTLGKNFDDLTISLAKKGIVRSLGAASLEMCMVAIGALDFYVVGRDFMRVTDIAASTLIVREAGGIVTDIHGETLDMPFSLNERTSVIAASSQDLVNKIISQL
jgi:fructose-1,6-bisphosphatase/inositol monophosphatase family enzyme